MRLGIGDTAKAAGFLIAKPHDADGATMLAPGMDQPRGGCRDRDPCAVVDRAGAQIPAVEMPADQHHAGGRIGAGQLADDIARFAVADLFRGQCQVQRHRLAELDHALEILGIRHG